MQVTLWHNPRCSKSREALKLLQDRGIEPRIRRYLEDPPNKHELNGLLQRLGITARQLIRDTEKEFKELNLNNGGASEAMLVAAMIEHPRLIQRPIAITRKGAVVGRPPEKVLEVIE